MDSTDLRVDFSDGTSAPGSEAGEPGTTLTIRSDLDVSVARQKARSLATTLGFGSVQLAELVTALSEIGNNIAQHAGVGTIRIQPLDCDGASGVLIIARDQGPGIPDIDSALRDGFSTSGGLGLGLPGAKRMMDVFDISSATGQGTVIRMIKWSTEAARKRARASPPDDQPPAT